MVVPKQDSTAAAATAANAFILYRPPHGHVREQVFFNEETADILARSPNSAPAATGKLIAAYCSGWMRQIDDKLKGKPITEGPADPRAVQVAVLESYRRKYAVRGMVLYDALPKLQSSDHHGRCYLFLLERMSGDGDALKSLYRRYKLNRREQDIIRLLMKGKCNKEIAAELGLSLNTIKSYLRLLMSKLGVTNRSGVLSVFLSGF